MLSDERVDRLQRMFVERAGRRPAGVWAAPGRVNLIGEHTDYNDGLVLPFAIERESLAAVALRDDGQLRCWSLQGEPVQWQRYPRGVLKALRAKGLTLSGADVVVDSDVPLGGGLSSSAALECSIALALDELAGGGLARMALASACQWAENNEVGALTGIMDQVASLFAAAGSLVLLDVRSLSVTRIAADLSGLTLLVIDSGVRHSNADSGYADRRRECAEVLQLLRISSLREADESGADELAQRPGREGMLGRRARHVVTENARVERAVALLRAQHPTDLGPLLTESHLSLRDDFEVSVPELDIAVEAAVMVGALGARMVGGGFGGSVLALVPDDAVGPVRAGVDAAYLRAGWQQPTTFAVRPAEGARRVR